MDAFVNKVKDIDAAPPLRVVSERSLQSVDLARLRSTHRRLARERDEMLRALGQACMQALTDPTRDADSLEMLRTSATAVASLEHEMKQLEQRIAQAHVAERLATQPIPFLTVCPCGSPVGPTDTACSICGRDVEALVRLAIESKSPIATVPCACGAALVAGIRFCPSCGRGVVDLLRAAGLAAPDQIVRCACGETLASDDHFCSSCGKATA